MQKSDIFITGGTEITGNKAFNDRILLK